MGTSVRILHVDGEVEFLEVAAELLEREDDRFDVTTESSAEDGLDRLASEPFDCIISDYRMPDVDGLEFLDRVREEHPALPFILFTGHGSESIASEAISRGATDYLQKQTGTEQYRLLANRVRNAVEGFRTERDLAQYRQLVETVGDAMYALDRDGAITIANETMAEMLDCDREEVVGTHASQFLSDGDFERASALVADIRDDPGRSWGTCEVTVESTAGTRFPSEINVAPLLEDDGEFRGSVGVVRDITERAVRERRLGALHDTSRALMDATEVDDAVAIALDAATDVLQLDVAAFFAPEGDEMVAVGETDGAETLLGTVSDVERGQELVWDAYETGEAIFASDVRDRLSVDWSDESIASELLVPADDHGVFVAASTSVGAFDETDEKLARVLVSNLTSAIDAIRRERLLLDRERELEQYETIVEAIPDEVYTLDVDGHFTKIIPPTGAETAASGYPPENLIGEPASIVMEDDDVAKAEEHIQEMIHNDDRENASFQMDLITTDGTRRPHENHIALLPDEANDTVRGTVGVLRDISDRKQRERELERQNERLEDFAKIASHDLRNPLNVATGRLQLARDECDSRHLDHVADALDRMETLIDDTLAMARQGQTVSSREPIDVGEMVPACWEAVATDGASVDVVDQVTVEADPKRLRQVFENLFRNAIEHGGPDVRVEVGAVDAGFYVADDGPGIPAGERSDVFDPGHTLAEGGTGFGLTIVAEIVDAHGWTIDVAASAHGGTRFEITDTDSPV